MSIIRGRFDKEANEAVHRYTASLPFDRRLYRYDIAGSIVHARMLARQGIILQEDAAAIVQGLREIEQEIASGRFQFSDAEEDIHMAIEARLTDKIGAAGARLHTARSRNDQIALDIRLFTRDAVYDALERIHHLQEVLLSVAEENREVVLPGYTHLQRAQPVLLAHHLLAYFEMLQRDTGRFADCLPRVNVMPLGSGALAGAAYAIDREFVARELGFAAVTRNSMDAVADRDFIIEYEAAASICLMHLSRLAEELVIWSSAEFGFVEMDDAYAHGSSIMPQKKNPDVAELARGKVGRVYGSLMALLTVMKGLPLTYDSDLQEDKEGFFDVVDTLLSTLAIFAGMIGTATFKPASMSAALDKGFLLATDLADYLVKKGETFRAAHSAVGHLVSWAVQNGKTFNQINLEDYRRFSALFEEDVYSITVSASLSARDNPGGTAPERVAAAMEQARQTLADNRGINKDRWSILSVI